MRYIKLALPWAIVLGLAGWISALPESAPTLSPATSNPAAINRAVVNQKLATLQIPFIANQGQRDPHVKFYAATLSGTTFVTQSGELVYSLPTQSPGTARPVSGKSRHVQTSPNQGKARQSKSKQIQTGQDESQVPHSPLPTPPSARGVVLTETLVGGRVHEITGEQPAQTTINSLHGNDPAQWRHDIPTYEMVSLGEVYAGITLKLKAHGKSVEKLFAIQPGAAPEQIKVKVSGGQGVAVSAAGELEVRTEGGAVRFSQPVAYQEAEGKRELVEVAYVVAAEEYGFHVGPYDRSRELVIDPLLATFLGGSGGNEEAFALALDGKGQVYVAGGTDSADFPGVTAGSAENSLAGEIDAFVAKLDANLSTILAATFLGGAGGGFGFSQALALALDSKGHVYVAGRTDSADFPGVTAGSADSSFAGVKEAFVAKLDGNLSTILAATFLGGAGSGLESEQEEAFALALDSKGQVYVAGRTDSADFPGVTAGSADSSLAGDGEAFVAKLDANLSSILATTFLGGDSDDVAVALALDGKGQVYVAGETDSEDFPGVTAGSADSSFNGFNEAFVATLDANLSTILAATFLGGSGLDGPGGLALDSKGQVYVAGGTGSADFPGVTAGSADSSFTGGEEAFVATLDANLSTILAATFLGGSSNVDGAGALALDSKGQVYVAGRTGSTDFPGVTAAGSADSSFAGGEEAFVATLDANLSSILAATFLGGSDFDEAFALALDSKGRVYVAGFTDSADFPGVTAGSADSSFAGGTEAFVAKLNATNLSVSLPSLDLLGRLAGLVATCEPFCPPAVRKPLHDEIERAIDQVFKGNIRAAANTLKQFVKRTERFMRSGQLPVEQGQRFIALATEIIAELSSAPVGGSGPGHAAAEEQG